MNVALLIAAGVGGMIAATAGPIFAGIMWRGTTKAGALAGFVAGAMAFMLSKSGIVKAAWFNDGPFAQAGIWFANQAPNPFACGTIGAIASVVVVIVVSWFTERPSAAHLQRVFGDRQTATHPSSGA